VTQADVLNRPSTTQGVARRADRHRPRRIAEVMLGAAVVLAAGLQTIGSVLASAYGADDIWASQGPAYRAVNGVTLWDQWLTTTSQWMTTQGRFFPGTTADWLVVYETFTTRESYKAFQLVIALAAIAVFAVWVARALRNAWAGLLAGVLVLACTQFRFFFDPILHFAGELPMLVLAMFGALILLQSFVRARRRHLLLLVGAMALWALALTTYESSYLVVPGALATIWMERAPRRRRLWATLSLGLPTLVLGATVAVLRSRVVHPLEVYSVNLDPTQFVPTLAKQLFATLPLSYTWSQHGHGIPSLRHAFEPSLASVILLVAVAVLTTVAILRMPRTTGRQLLALTALGVSLLLAAASVTAVSRFWQHTLELGQGYIGVFVQSLGLALLVVCAASLRPGGKGALARRASAAIALVCGLVVGWAVVATGQQNDRVVTASDPNLGSWAGQPALGFPRELTTAAFERGLLAGHPSGGVVYGNPGGPWFNSVFLSQVARQRVTVPNEWPYFSLAPGVETRLPGCGPVGPCAPQVKAIDTVTVRADSYERGVVVLARARQVDQLGPFATQASVTTDQARVYYSGYGAEHRLCAKASRAGGVVGVDPSLVRVVASGTGWTIADVSFAAPGVPAANIALRSAVDGSCP
jgi:hypothetical protein